MEVADGVAHAGGADVIGVARTHAAKGHAAVERIDRGIVVDPVQPAQTAEDLQVRVQAAVVGSQFEADLPIGVGGELVEALVAGRLDPAGGGHAVQRPDLDGLGRREGVHEAGPPRAQQEA